MSEHDKKTNLHFSFKSQEKQMLMGRDEWNQVPRVKYFFKEKQAPLIGEIDAR